MVYGERNIVDRLIACLDESRRVLTRREKTATYYLSVIKETCVRRYRHLMTVACFSDSATMEVETAQQID